MFVRCVGPALPGGALRSCRKCSCAHSCGSATPRAFRYGFASNKLQHVMDAPVRLRCVGNSTAAPQLHPHRAGTGLCRGLVAPLLGMAGGTAGPNPLDTPARIPSPPGQRHRPLPPLPPPTPPTVAWCHRSVAPWPTVATLWRVRSPALLPNAQSTTRQSGRVAKGGVPRAPAAPRPHGATAGAPVFRHPPGGAAAGAPFPASRSVWPPCGRRPPRRSTARPPRAGQPADLCFVAAAVVAAASAPTGAPSGGRGPRRRRQFRHWRP